MRCRITPLASTKRLSEGKFVIVVILAPSNGLIPCTFKFLRVLIVNCFVYHQFNKKFVELI